MRNAIAKAKPDRPKSPDPLDILVARRRAKLTQTNAAALIYTPMRTWQQWEAGISPMHPGLWELFQLKVAQL